VSDGCSEFADSVSASAIALSEGVLTSLSFLVMTLDQATVLKPLKCTRLPEQKTRVLRLQILLFNS
jgi:hypothetical protein